MYCQRILPSVSWALVWDHNVLSPYIAISELGFSLGSQCIVTVYIAISELGFSLGSQRIVNVYCHQ